MFSMFGLPNNKLSVFSVSYLRHAHFQTQQVRRQKKILRSETIQILSYQVWKDENFLLKIFYLSDSESFAARRSTAIIDFKNTQFVGMFCVS